MSGKIGVFFKEMQREVTFGNCLAKILFPKINFELFGKII
jgi:hypothetical protein